METKFNLSVENIDIMELNDKFDFAVARVWCVHDGFNENNWAITPKALVKAKDTLINKPLVGKIGEYGDLEGHEDDEIAMGVFPESSKMEFVEKDGKNFLVAEALIWKKYSKNLIWLFQDFNRRPVSIEGDITKSHFDEYRRMVADEIIFNGVTILGLEVAERSKRLTYYNYRFQPCESTG